MNIWKENWKFAGKGVYLVENLSWWEETYWVEHFFWWKRFFPHTPVRKILILTYNRTFRLLIQLLQDFVDWCLEYCILFISCKFLISCIYHYKCSFLQEKSVSEYFAKKFTSNKVTLIIGHIPVQWFARVVNTFAATLLIISSVVEIKVTSVIIKNDFSWTKYIYFSFSETCKQVICFIFHHLVIWFWILFYSVGMLV